MDFEDKVVVVTGAASGIGRATSLKFASEGAKVVVADIRKEPREGGVPTREKIENNTEGEAAFIKTDVREWESMNDCAKEVVERFGQIHAWINNAGILMKDSLEDISIKEWRETMRVNLDGVFYGTKAAAHFMKPQRTGEIVNIASVLGKSGASPYISYCASKFGVIGFTEAVAEDLKGSGVSVNAVCPKLTATRMTGFRGEDPENVAETVLSVVRANYTGRAVDVS